MARPLPAHPDQTPARRTRFLGLGALLLSVVACGSGVAADPDASGGASVGSTTGNGGFLSGSGSVSGGGTGSVPGTPTGGGASVACGLEVDAGSQVLRRLSVLEYQLTIQDLLALPAPPNVEGIPLDTERLGFRTYADLQTMSAENLRGYLDLAEGFADALFQDSARRMKVVGCELASEGCLETFVQTFGKVAYRRPLEPTEIATIAEAARAAALDQEDSYKFVIEALLSAPSFLFRVEVGNQKEGLSTLSPLELASKLSFALHGRAPSLELLQKAESGALDSPEGFAQVAEEMLNDERAHVFFAAFFRQWLGYQTLKPPTPADNAVFADMQTETDRLAAEYAWGSEDFLGILTSNHTYLTPELADYYGLPAPDSEGRLELPASSPRANSGVLTHASLLSAKGDGDLISIRGNWLRKTFLCESLELPPDLADTIGEVLVGLDRVGIFEARNTLGDCSVCHAKIDPIGLGLFVFDRRGIFDPTVDLGPYAMTPALPDAPAPNEFETMGELGRSLGELPAVPGCMAERTFLYVHGREPSALDACAVQRISSDFAGSGHAFRAMLASLVKSSEFRLRRAPAAL